MTYAFSLHIVIGDRMNKFDKWWRIRSKGILCHHVRNQIRTRTERETIKSAPIRRSTFSIVNIRRQTWPKAHLFMNRASSIGPSLSVISACMRVCECVRESAQRIRTKSRERFILRDSKFSNISILYPLQISSLHKLSLTRLSLGTENGKIW